MKLVRRMLLFVLMGMGLVESSLAATFTLSSECPPSFDKVGNGVCRYVSLYQLYTASPGQGGLRAPLPPIRDGFTPEQIDLGRYLFFDPLLSADRRTSCASCHNPDRGFSDGRRTAMGSGGVGVGPDRHAGVPLRRSTPSLWNVGFLTKLFWDAHANSLEEQMQGPLFSPGEMANTPEQLLKGLSSNAEYTKLFSVAYGRPASEPIKMSEVAAAIAAFEATLVSVNSRYDRYAHGDSNALSATERRGYNVFRGFVARCSQCHIPPLFASSEVAVVGAPAVAGQPYDLGVAALKDDPAMRGAFKVPTLRNIALTAPYFQAGQFDTLEEVVDFYNAKRGHAVPPGVHTDIHWHVHMERPELSKADCSDLVAFLRALTDQSSLPEIPAAVPSGLSLAPTLSNSTSRKP